MPGGRYTGVNTAGQVVSFPQNILEVYSLDIERTALAVMRYEDFAVIKDDLTKAPGEVILIPKYNNIKRGGRLAEHEYIQENALSGSQVPIRVTEWGNAVGLTEKQLQLGWDDLLAEAAIQLGRDYAVVNDLMLRDAVMNATNVIYAGAKDSRAALVGLDDYLSVEELDVAIEILQTAQAPKYNDDYYISFVHPHQVAYIRRDPEWIGANNYANTRALFLGELGRWNDIVFISTTHQPNGAAASDDPGYEAALHNAATGGANPADVYRAVVMGDYAFGKATALPVEMRDNGVQDYGRKHGLAWYSIMGADILEDNHIVIVETV